MNITLDIGNLSSKTIRKIAHATLDDAVSYGKSRGHRMAVYQQAKYLVAALEVRANGGDTSELREIMKHLQALIDMQKPSVAEFKRARAARRVAKVSPPSSCIAYKC